MLNNERTYGVEIEFTDPQNHGRERIAEMLRAAGVDTTVESYNHNTRRHFKLTTDASVRNGYELVSPILKGDAGLDKLRIVSDVLIAAGCSANTSTGLHVHHDINDLGGVAVTNLFKTYADNEHLLDGVMPRSRRGAGAQYVRSLREHRAALHDALSMHDIRIALGTRYKKLNIESYWRYGTVEFRHHSGTVEFKKIANWVKLTQAMVERSVHGSIENSRSINTFLTRVFDAAVARTSSFGGRGIARIAREHFEAGITDRAAVLASIKMRYPEAKTNLRRVGQYYTAWLNSTAVADTSEENSSVINFYLNRYEFFNRSSA